MEYMRKPVTARQFGAQGFHQSAQGFHQSDAGAIDMSTAPRIGQTTVVDRWDGSRWIQVILAWDGQRFVEVPA